MHPYLSGPRPRAYAHRGWHTGDLTGCENTLAAFTKAVEEGFAYLELDVHASADGVAVIHHDPRLDRTTDATGRLDEHTAAELEKVLVHGREPIPQLQQVLAALPDTRFTIELKSAAVVAPTLAVLERADAWDRVCLGGVEQAWLDAARRGGGERLCTSMAKRDALALRSRAWLDALPGPLSALPSLPLAGDIAHVPVSAGPIRVVDARLLRTAHEWGREVHVWTINRPDQMRQLLDLGVDGLLTDRPDLLREVCVSADSGLHDGHRRARPGARVGPLGLGVVGLQRRDPYFCLFGLPDRRGRQRPAGPHRRRGVARVLNRRGGAPHRAGRPGTGPARGRGGAAQAVHRRVDRVDGRDDGRSVRRAGGLPLALGRPRAPRSRIDLLRAGFCLL